MATNTENNVPRVIRVFFVMEIDCCFEFAALYIMICHVAILLVVAVQCLVSRYGLGAILYGAGHLNKYINQCCFKKSLQRI